MKIKCVAILLMLLPVVSCSSDDDLKKETNNLTQYEVHFKIDTKVFDSELKEPGGYKFYKAPHSNGTHYGLGGVIVYNNGTELVAYDSTCPFEWTLKSGVYREGKQEIICGYPKYCQSVFDINTGQPISGPAKEKNLHLVQYDIESQGDGIHIVTNKRYKK